MLEHSPKSYDEAKRLHFERVDELVKDMPEEVAVIITDILDLCIEKQYDPHAAMLAYKFLLFDSSAFLDAIKLEELS